MHPGNVWVQIFHCSYSCYLITAVWTVTTVLFASFIILPCFDCVNLGLVAGTALLVYKNPVPMVCIDFCVELFEVLPLLWAEKIFLLTKSWAWCVCMVGWLISVWWLDLQCSVSHASSGAWCLCWFWLSNTAMTCWTCCVLIV